MATCLHLEAELVALRAEAERQSEELQTLSEELNGSRASASQLLAQLAALDAEKRELETKLQQFIEDKRESETNVVGKLEREKMLSDEKGTVHVHCTVHTLVPGVAKNFLFFVCNCYG